MRWTPSPLRQVRCLVDPREERSCPNDASHGLEDELFEIYNPAPLQVRGARAMGISSRCAIGALLSHNVKMD